MGLIISAHDEIATRGHLQELESRLLLNMNETLKGIFREFLKEVKEGIKKSKDGNESLYYTPKEVAALLGCSDQTILNKIGDGTIVAFRWHNNKLLPFDPKGTKEPSGENQKEEAPKLGYGTKWFVPKEQVETILCEDTAIYKRRKKH